MGNSGSSLLCPQRERQAQREDALELTEKLDQDWKEIQGLVSCRAPKTEGRDWKKPQVDKEMNQRGQGDDSSVCGEGQS